MATNKQSPTSAVIGIVPCRSTKIVDRGCYIRRADRLVIGRKLAPVNHGRRSDCFWRPSLRPAVADKRLDQIVDWQVRINVMTNPNRSVEGENDSPWIEPVLREREIGIREDDPEKQQRVGFLNHFCDRRIPGRAEISSKQDVGCLLQKARPMKVDTTGRQTRPAGRACAAAR